MSGSIDETFFFMRKETPNETFQENDFIFYFFLLSTHSDNPHSNTLHFENKSRHTKALESFAQLLRG